MQVGWLDTVSLHPDYAGKSNCTVGVRCHPPAVITKMEALGARVVTRFGKDVTHIIFQKHAKTASAEQREAEAAELRALYDKIEKVQLPAVRPGGPSAAWQGLACPRWLGLQLLAGPWPGSPACLRALCDMIDQLQLRLLCVTGPTSRSVQL